MKNSLIGLLLIFFLGCFLTSCKNNVTDDNEGQGQTESGKVEITYSSEYGSVPPSKIVDKGYVLTSNDLSTLTAEGYIFEGWNKNVGDIITSNITIMASWKSESSNPGSGDGEFEYQEYSSYVVLKGIGSYTGTEIIVPETYNEKPVNQIGTEAFKDNTSITKVVVPSSITYIGSSAFSGCTSLTSVIISSKASFVGSYAFKDCVKLSDIKINQNLPSSVNGIFDNSGKDVQNVTVEFSEGVTYIPSQLFQPSSTSARSYITKVIIPTTVTTIGYQAFYDCTRLEEIDFKAESLNDFSSGAYVFENAGTDAADGTKVIFASTVKKVPHYFSGCENVPPKFTSVQFEEGSECSSIGNFAFNRTAITSIDLPETIKSIGNYAFYNTTLTSIVLPDSLKSIGQYAFYGCEKLESINVPVNVTSIGIYAFYSTKSLKSIVYAAKNVGDFSESNYIFPSDYTSKFELLIKNTVESVPGNFMNRSGSSDSGCTKISFEDNSSLKKIGEKAFYMARSITSCPLPDSVEEIGKYCFYYDWSIKDCRVPQSLKSMGEYAFYFVGFEKIEIPAGLTRIPPYAFSGAAAGELSLQEGLLTIGERAFSSNQFTSLIVPESVTSIGAGAFSYNEKLESAEFKCEMTEIPENLLYGNISLTNLIIPQTYTTIGKQAFYDCRSLPSITIPQNVVSIGDSAFYNCDRATSLTIEEGTLLREIPKNCFYNCKSLSEINLPEGITTIKTGAFHYGASITSITIPESVECIEEDAFQQISDSVSSLTLNFNAVNCRNNEGLDFSDNLISTGTVTTTVVIGANVTRIPSNLCAQINCVQVTFKGNACKEIGDYAFYYSALNGFDIPSSVETIGVAAFMGNLNYTTVRIPASVKKIGERAFYTNGNRSTSGDTKLTSITFDTSTGWYITGNSDYTGGTAASLSSASSNATLYNNNALKYWYR